MKLQYLAVIFIIIFLPIILVTTFYVQQQMETINNQLEYDAALLDATHDAMIAFEINTANEDLSTVSDSLRSIIEASNNIFLNTLSINFGMSNASKSSIQPYIPAVLYSLYDGYYIYSPTNMPIVCTDQFGQTISTDSYGVSFTGTVQSYITPEGYTVKYGVYNFDESSLTYPSEDSVIANGGDEVIYDDLPDDIKSEYGQMLYENEDGTYSTVIHTDRSGTVSNSKYKISYILKSYVPYAVTYANSNANVTINYTLDNYISIMGFINGVYYSKSGYLIDNNLISEVIVNGVPIEWNTYSDEELLNMANNPEEYEVLVFFYPDELGNTITISNTDNWYHDGEGKAYWEDAQSAVAYYARAWAFSKWVYETPALRSLRESDTVTSVYNIVNENVNVEYNDVKGISENLLYNFTASDNEIFYVNTLEESDDNYKKEAKKADPENSESNFVEHKRHAIRNSITYNLCLAMTAYNEKYSGMTFEMPVLKDEEWDKILSNVSILTFMQGLDCGHKIYNNYALVCSTNNEISVTPGEIYYTNYTSSLTDGDADYNEDGVIDGVIETVHRINCPHLDYINDNTFYTSLKSKEIKYDKNYSSIYGLYEYDHKSYTCYTCLVNPNYIGISNRRNGSEGLIDSIYPKNDDGTLNADGNYISKLKAYYLAVGKERNNLYKPTAVSESSAFEIIEFEVPAFGYNVEGTTVLPLENMTLGTTNSQLPINRISKIDVTFDGICKDPGVNNLYTASIQISLNGQDSMSYGQVVIPVNSTVTRTIQLSGSFDVADTVYLESLKFKLSNEAVNFNVRSIKIYYK